MRYRYYSTQRPVAPGTFPKPAGNRVIGIHNYDARSHVAAIGRDAWGYIEYAAPLDPRMAEEYELTYGGDNNDD